MDKLEKAVLKLQNGDANSLGVIYDLTSKGVFTFVLPILHDYQLAEDVMQQTYIKVYENINSYSEKISARNWILTIAKNTALTEMKKRQREVSIDFSQEFNADELATFDKNFDTPLITLASKVLTKEEFHIVLLFAVGDYKHREIAEMLNLPLGTVTWKYNNAIKKLRDAVNKNRNAYERKKEAY